MPEEINRLVTDAITNYFFTTSEIANKTLRSGGYGEDQIFFVGNCMIDTGSRPICGEKVTLPTFSPQIGRDPK